MKKLNVMIAASLIFLFQSWATAGYQNENSSGSKNKNTRRYTSVPAEAESIYSVEKSCPNCNFEALKSEALKEMRNIESRSDLELTCHTIIYDWKDSSQINCYEGNGWGPGGCFNPFNQLFGTSQFINSKIILVQAYCVKRSFDQKMLVSLVRQCETNPTMECYQMRETFKDIDPLQRIHLSK